MISMQEYQDQALTTFTSRTGETHNELVARIAFGICGEAGEIAEAVKKYLRGDYDFRALQHRVAPELGDVIWYVAVMAKLMGVSLDDVAQENLAKLVSRKERGVLKGSGNER